MYSGIFFIINLASGAFRKVPNEHKVKGRIDYLEQRYKSHKRMVSRTAIVLYDVEGRIYNVETSYQSSFFQPGQKLVVCYDAENPQNSFVRAGIIIYIFMYASLIVGTVYIVKDIIVLII